MGKKGIECIEVPQQVSKVRFYQSFNRQLFKSVMWAHPLYVMTWLHWSIRPLDPHCAHVSAGCSDVLTTDTYLDKGRCKERLKVRVQKEKLNRALQDQASRCRFQEGDD